MRRQSNWPTDPGTAFLARQVAGYAAAVTQFFELPLVLFAVWCQGIDGLTTAQRLLELHQGGATAVTVDCLPDGDHWARFIVEFKA